MSQTVRTVLTFLAATMGALIAVDPFGLPTWASAVMGALVVGFAAIGIVPPTLQTLGTRRYVRGDIVPPTAINPRTGDQFGRRGGGWRN